MNVTDLSFQVVVASIWPLMGSVLASNPHKRVWTGMSVDRVRMYLKDYAEMKVFSAPESNWHVVGAQFMSR